MQRSARSPHPPLSVQALGQLSDDTIICDTPSLPTESRVAGIGVLVLNPGQLEPGVLYLPLGHEITLYNSEEVSSRTQQSLTAISHRNLSHRNLSHCILSHCILSHINRSPPSRLEAYWPRAHLPPHSPLKQAPAARIIALT